MDSVAHIGASRNQNYRGAFGWNFACAPDVGARTGRQGRGFALSENRRVLDLVSAAFVKRVVRAQPILQRQMDMEEEVETAC
jgi:hypothetical protein